MMNTTTASIKNAHYFTNFEKPQGADTPEEYRKNRSPFDTKLYIPRLPAQVTPKSGPATRSPVYTRKPRTDVSPKVGHSPAPSQPQTRRAKPEVCDKIGYVATDRAVRPVPAEKSSQIQKPKNARTMTIATKRRICRDIEPLVSTPGRSGTPDQSAKKKPAVQSRPKRAVSPMLSYIMNGRKGVDTGLVQRMEREHNARHERGTSSIFDRSYVSRNTAENERCFTTASSRKPPPKPVIRTRCILGTNNKAKKEECK